MDHLLQILVAVVAALSTLLVADTLSSDARRRRRVVNYLDLASRFADGSVERRAFSVVARDAAVDLAADRLVRGSWGLRTVVWVVVAVMLAGTVLLWRDAARAARADQPDGVEGDPMGSSIIVIAFVLLAFCLEATLRRVRRNVRDSLLEDGWYLDIAEWTYLTTRRSMARYLGPRFASLDARRDVLVTAGKVERPAEPRSTERAENVATMLREVFGPTR